MARITKNTMVTRMKTVGIMRRNLVSTKRKKLPDSRFFFVLAFAGVVLEVAMALSDTRCSLVLVIGI